MRNKVRHLRSDIPSFVPTPDELPVGHIGVNTYDGFLFIKKVTDEGETVVTLGRTPTPEDIGAASIEQGELADTAIQPDALTEALSTLTLSDTSITSLISLDPNNRLTKGTDNGLYVSDSLTPDPLITYLLERG